LVSPLRDLSLRLKIAFVEITENVECLSGSFFINFFYMVKEEEKVKDGQTVDISPQ
jgi:hypothetical protein